MTAGTLEAQKDLRRGTRVEPEKTAKLGICAAVHTQNKRSQTGLSDRVGKTKVNPGLGLERLRYELTTLSPPHSVFGKARLSFPLTSLLKGKWN